MIAVFLSNFDLDHGQLYMLQIDGNGSFLLTKIGFINVLGSFGKFFLFQTILELVTQSMNFIPFPFFCSRQQFLNYLLLLLALSLVIYITLIVTEFVTVLIPLLPFLLSPM